ncbi:MAG: DNA-processing protein DprA [Prevotella sp.]|nr:DNA-processing protein DprA [Prevotella sp.]MDY5546420.1 DNA-processing protein DprA [Prevotella sp.]
MDRLETIYTMALARINFFGLAGLLELYRKLGSATDVMDHRKHILEVLPDASPRLQEALDTLDAPLERAREEYDWCQEHGISMLCLADDGYPKRLKECADAPLVLYYKGTADLNQRRIVSMVGTRHCTMYGDDFIRRFMADLKEICPQLLVVSGLAYGIDVIAHREALANGYDTVGVLAHGLDTLYPSSHRDIANRMTHQGGLLTEHMSHTKPDKINFVRRNRIVAGIADCCIMVESAARGGSLITAGMALDYGRDVFAVPGRTTDSCSEGCNNLIRDNGASLLTCAADLVKVMGWEADAQLAHAQSQGIERSLFPSLSADEQKVVDVLRQANDQQVNLLSVKAGMPVGKLAATLFGLEMKGMVKALAGGVYHLYQ